MEDERETLENQVLVDSRVKRSRYKKAISLGPEPDGYDNSQPIPKDSEIGLDFYIFGEITLE